MESTGLKDLQQKLVTYWTLATHSLPHVNKFPIIAVQGKTGTGKSQALSIIGNFAQRPVPLSLRGMTTPTIRDRFNAAYEGTAIIEEADCAWRDPDTSFEHLLSDRYQRTSAEAYHKVKRSDKDWATMRKKFFGATALHRRILFKDAALDGRTVRVRTQPDHSRQYKEFKEDDSWNAEGKQVVSDLTFHLPSTEQPQGIAGRVFDTYRPILGAARLCGDRAFEEHMRSKLLQETLELKEAQSSEPDGLVVQAIVELVFGCASPEFRNLRFRDLSQRIWENHRISLDPRQIGPIARDLGFATKTSHGVTVVVPTPATLLRACDECDYTDEAIDELRRDALASEGGSI